MSDSRLQLVAAAADLDVANAQLMYRLSSLKAALLEEECASLEASVSVQRRVQPKKLKTARARKINNCGVWWRPMRLL